MKRLLIVLIIGLFAALALFFMWPAQIDSRPVPYTFSLQDQIRDADIILVVAATGARPVEGGHCEYEVTINDTLKNDLASDKSVNIPDTMKIYDRLNGKDYASLIIGKTSPMPPCEPNNSQYLLFLHGMHIQEFFENGKMNPRSSYLRPIRDKESVLEYITHQ